MVPNAPNQPFPAGFDAKPAPFGVGFVGAQCSEPKLIELAYAFEQATKRRVPPAGYAVDGQAGLKTRLYDLNLTGGSEDPPLRHRVSLTSFRARRGGTLRPACSTAVSPVPRYRGYQSSDEASSESMSYGPLPTKSVITNVGDEPSSQRVRYDVANNCLGRILFPENALEVSLLPQRPDVTGLFPLMTCCLLPSMDQNREI